MLIPWGFAQPLTKGGSRLSLSLRLEIGLLTRTNSGNLLPIMNAEEQKRWMEQWRAAGAAMEGIRAEELQQLDEARNAEISSSFFVTERPRRRNTETSGLVKQQAIFQRARER